jgi:hypothetical protein
MIGAAAIIVWGGSACCVMFGTLKFFGQLRVSEEEERKGKLIFMFVPCILYNLSSRPTNAQHTYIQGDKKSLCNWLLQYQNTQKYFKQFQSLTMIT